MSILWYFVGQGMMARTNNDVRILIVQVHRNVLRILDSLTSLRDSCMAFSLTRYRRIYQAL